MNEQEYIEKSKAQQKEKTKQEKLALVLLIVIFMILGLFSSSFKFAYVEGSSMEPNIKDSERALILKIGKIDRFDIIVFNRDDKSAVKRVIGLPGDKIKYDSEGKLYVNDKVIEEYFLTSTQINCTCNNEISTSLKGCYEDIIVPENNYFVLGDNRNVSYDSRVYGCVSKDQVIGRLVYMMRSSSGNFRKVK